MKEALPKETTLKNVRDALIEKADNPFDTIDLESNVFPEITDPLDVVFAENFIRNGGKFIFCEGINETVDNIRFFAQQEKWDKIYAAEESIQRILVHAGISYSNDQNELILRKVAVTSCECLVARTGSIVISSKSPSGRKPYAGADTLVFVATTAQLVPDLRTALKQIKNKYATGMPSMIQTLSGITYVRDIDGQITDGLGPQQHFLFLVDAK